MNEKYLKWGIVVGIGYYLFYKNKKGKKETGLLGFKNPNPETVMNSVMPWLKVNPVVEPFIKNFGTKFLSSVMEFEDDNDVIDVKYRSLR